MILIRNHQKKILIAIFFSVIIFYFQNSGFHINKSIILTNTEKEWLKKNRKNIRISFYKKSAPFEFVDEYDRIKGIGPEIISLIEKKLNIVFDRVSSENWNDHLSNIKSGKIPIVSALVKNPERSQSISFTSSYAKMPIVIISANKAKGVELSKISSSVTVVSGYATDSYVRSIPERKYRINTVKDIPEALRSVSFGKTDYFVGNLAMASYFISREGITNLHVVGITDYYYKFCIGVNKNYPLLFSSVKKALENIPEETIDSINQKWITLDYQSIFSNKTKEIIKTTAYIVVSLFIALVTIIYFLNRKLKMQMENLKEAEYKIIRKDERHRALFKNSPLPVIEMKRDTKEVFLNSKFEEIFGFTEKDIKTADDLWNLAYPDTSYREEVKKDWDTFLLKVDRFGISSKQNAYKMTTRNGKEIYVYAGVVKYREKLLITLFDVSELTESKEEIKRSRQRFRALFNLLPFSCIVSDLEGKIITVNDHFCSRTNNSYKDTIGKNLYNDVGFIVPPKIKDRIKKKMRSKNFVHNEEIFIVRNNSISYHLFSSRYIEWKGKTAVLSALLEITDRKEAEEALRKSEERLNFAFDAANDGIWDLNLSETSIYNSPNYLKMLGYEPDEIDITWETFDKLLHPEDSDTFYKNYNDYLDGKSDKFELEFRLKTKEGGYKWILSRGKVTQRDEKGKPLRFVGTNMDITEIRKIQEALEESEKNFKIILNSIGDAVIATDVNGNITKMNPVAEKLTGWREEEVLLKNLEAVFDFTNWDTDEKIPNPVAKVLEAKDETELTKHLKIVSRNSKEYHVSALGKPIFSSEKEKIGVVFVLRDITKDFEREQYLAQSQKMEAIGTLAGGIAHDFNNILSASMGFTDLAMLQTDGNPKLERYLKEIETANLRARDLVKHIQTFSCKAELKKQLLDINPLIKETIKFIRATFPSNINIEYDIKTDISLVISDPTQIHRILMNLFTNSAYAMKPKGGTLKIEVDSVKISHFEIPENKDKSYIEIIVCDTGHGIPDKIKDRIFEPFFTTKPRGEGTGMGLSAVYGILKEMNGDISVESREGTGTTFKVHIPEQSKPVPSAEKDRKKQNLLLIDGDSSLESNLYILMKSRYNVECLANADEALNRLKNEPDFFDLVIADITPEINGEKLSEDIKRINKEISVILCSEFSRDFRSYWVDFIIMKPVIPEELLKAINKILK